MVASIPRLDRLVPAIGLAAALCLGQAACSSGEGDPKPKPEADETTSAEPEPDWRAIAEDALVPADLPALAEYEAGDETREPDDVVPMEVCVDEVPESFEGRAATSRDFEPPDPGDRLFDVEPDIRALAVAVDGPAATAFADLREIWKSKQCGSYERTEAGYPTKFTRVSTLEVPKGVDKDSWFGACYDGDPDAGGGSTLPVATGRCFAIYVSGEHSLTQVTGTYIPAQRLSGGPGGIDMETESGEKDCRKVVTTVAHEALAI